MSDLKKVLTNENIKPNYVPDGHYENEVIDHVHMNDDAMFSRCTFNNCTFNECTFKELKLFDGKISNCKFNDCEFDVLSIADGKINKLTLDNCQIKTFKIHRMQFDSLSVCERYINEISIMNSIGENLNLNKLVCDNIDMLYVLISGRLNIEGCYVEKFSKNKSLVCHLYANNFRLEKSKLNNFEKFDLV